MEFRQSVDLAQRRVPGSDDLAWTGEVFAEEAAKVCQHDIQCIGMRHGYALGDDSQCADDDDDGMIVEGRKDYEEEFFTNRGQQGWDSHCCFTLFFLLSIGDEVREVGPAPRCCCDG